jgi:SAM-dependent methyltransferase
MKRRDLGKPLPFARYDQRHYTTADVAAGYAKWSAIYGDLDDRLDLDLFEASPLLAARVAGAEVVDLGCGNGRVGRWLASHGAARVVGVDRTPEMLAGARARGVYADTHLADLLASGLAASSFDGAVSSLVLCHLPSLDGFFAEAARLLRPGGWLAVADYHPFFLLTGVPTHFDDPATGQPVAIENHVHAMRDFFRCAGAAGLVVRELEERFVDDAWADASPAMRKHVGKPISHFWACEKTS